MSFLQGVRVHSGRVRAASIQVTGLGGFVVFIEGIRQVYQPAALIVGGALVVAWTIMKVRSTE